VTVRTRYIGGGDAAALAERAKAKRKAIVTNVKVASTCNRWPVDPAEIRKALALQPRPVDEAK
jgi:S-DNA-T family DNA segregation ATPase FtsK/SpoIIIE